MRVLLVEDDRGVAEALTEALAQRGHVPTWVERGVDALNQHHGADLVLLDLNLPDINGLEVLRRLRQISEELPILVLTAEGDERMVVRGLRLGAADYVVKPVRLLELLARMDNVVGRVRRRPAAGSPMARVADVQIDFEGRQVRAGGDEIFLTTKEFDLLAELAAEPGVAVSRQQLMDKVWGYADPAISKSLDVHMTQLRGKLNRPGLLTTIRGFGYRLDG